MNTASAISTFCLLLNKSGKVDVNQQIQNIEAREDPTDYWPDAMTCQKSAVKSVKLTRAVPW